MWTTVVAGIAVRTFGDHYQVSKEVLSRKRTKSTYHKHLNSLYIISTKQRCDMQSLENTLLFSANGPTAF